MVIDELILILGLDASRFTEGQRDALAAFKKTKEGAEEFGKDVERQGVKLAEIFGALRKGVLGIVGAFVGNEAVQFINHVAGMDAATGRWAKTIGTTVENLSLWQQMIRQINGDAGSATSTLYSMQQELENIRLRGKMPDGALVTLSNLAGFNLMGRGGSDEFLRKVRSYIASQMESGKMNPSQAANLLGSIPGMNQDMINLLLMETKAFNDLAEAAQKVGTAAKASADAGAQLQQTGNLIAQFWESIARRVLPAVGAISKGINDTISQGHYGAPGSLIDRLARWMTGASATSSAGSGGRASATDREAWINSFAAMSGIDPQVANRVARSEGFGTYAGDNGSSFGDFQLHVTPGGRGNAVGDAFRKQTGLDPSDPANERAMDQFALQWAAKYGWNDFHGAARSGISQWQGIGAKAAAANRSINNSRSSSSSQTNDVSIGKIEVNAPHATDANGIASEIGGALKRTSMISGVNSGLV